MSGTSQVRRPGLAAPAPLPEPHLADTTVWSKVRPTATLADWFNDQVRAGRVLTCDIVAMELLRSARNKVAFGVQAGLLEQLVSCPIGAAEHSRAKEVQRLLAARGTHRGIPPMDLLIASSAESAGVPVLHYDHDYDLIAVASGQVARWFVAAGSLP